MNKRKNNVSLFNTFHTHTHTNTNYPPVNNDIDNRYFPATFPMIVYIKKIQMTN